MLVIIAQLSCQVIILRRRGLNPVVCVQCRWRFRRRCGRRSLPVANRTHFGTNTNNGRANLPVCPNLTASQRGDAGGTLGICTPEHRSARSGGSLGGAAAPPYLGVVSGCARPNQNKQG